MTKSLVDRFIAIFGSTVIGFLVGILLTPIIVRVLGSTRYGDYAFVLSILSMLLLFVDAGVFDGIRKFLKETDRSAEWRHQVFAFYVRVALALVSITVATILIIIDIGVIQTYFGQRFEQYFVLVAMVVASRQAFTISRSTLMGFDREDISETLQVTNTLLFAICGLLLLYFGFGVSGLIASKFVANLTAAGAGLLVASRYIDYSYLFRKTSEKFPHRQLLTFNFMSIVLFGLYISIKHVDIVLIQFYHGSQMTGYYKAALKLAEFVWFIPRIVQTTLLHSTSELWVEDKHSMITEISGRLTRYTFLFTALLIIGLGALAEPTVTLYYGQEFQPSVVPLLILLPGALGFAIARPIMAIGQGKGELRYLVYATGTAAFINLGLNLLLIPRFGIIGAAVATSIGYFSMLLFHIVSARAIGFNPLDDLRLPNIAVTILVTAGPIFLLAAVIQSAILSLLLVPPIGLLIYSGVAISVGTISIEEMRELVGHISF